MNVILIVMSVLIFCILAIQVIFFLKLAQFSAIIANFFYSPDEKTPSAFATLSQDFGTLIGRSAAMEVKTTLMGKASGEARLETAIQGDMFQDQVASQSPALGMILDSFPTLKKRAFKNPGVMEFLLSRLGNSGVGSTGSNSSGGGNYSARLAKYR